MRYLLITLLMFSTTAQADWATAGYMFKQCKDLGENEFNYGFCYGYVLGAAAGLTKNCITGGNDYTWKAYVMADPEDTLAAFIEFSEKRPDLWSEGSWGVIALALSEKFPCIKN